MNYDLVIETRMWVTSLWTNVSFLDVSF